MACDNDARRVPAGNATLRAVGHLSIGAGVVLLLVVTMSSLSGQSRPSKPSAGASPLAGVSQSALRSPPGAAQAPTPAPKMRALLDQYCVTCHNDRVKTANLSLQGLDLATVGEHAELWEKVVRKLRAGVMPPPDVPRPSLAEYEGLRDWLEAEIDRNGRDAVNPGAVVLHRLNRTEYANADPRSARPRDRRHDAAAAGRFGARLRQHRRAR